MATSRQGDEEAAASVENAFTREELLRKGGAAAAAIGLGGALAGPASALKPTTHPDPGKMSVVARAVLAHPRVIHEFDTKRHVLVLGLKDELLVLTGPKLDNQGLRKRLHEVARLSTTLRDAPIVHKGFDVGLPDGFNVEVWRLTNPDKQGNAFKQARELRQVVEVAFPPSKTLVPVPTVSPNHVSVVAGNYDMCPDGPPRLPKDGTVFAPILSYSDSPRAVSVAVIDTGWIPFGAGPTERGNRPLTDRGGIARERAWWPDTSRTGVSLRNAWRTSGDDDLVTYPDILRGLDRLAGVAGHGTFVTGILAAGCRNANITVVAHRHSVLPIPGNGVAPITGVDAQRLFESEVAVAVSVLKHRNKQVISCGFAFPTLDGYRSLPFLPVLASLDPDAVMLAPAGNENTASEYWPAAHERVIAVAAAAGETGRTKADFSNYGRWIDCWSPGVDAVSTFGYVTAVPQEDDKATRSTPASRFKGWAVWNGTCFATPIVTARIAREAAERNVTAMQAWNNVQKRAMRGGRHIRVAGTTRPVITADYPP